MKFKQYIKNSDTVNMIELAYFLDEFDENSVNEGITKNILDKLKIVLIKTGLKSHKSGKGLLQVLTSSTKNISTLMYYVFKVAQGNDEYKEKIKELVKKVKKEDVLDVLFRLDLLTLHAITGPIHILDALTGWHIGPDLKKNAMEIDDRAKKVIEHMNVLISSTIGETKIKLVRFLKQLKNNFKFSSQISTDVLKGV